MCDSQNWCLFTDFLPGSKNVDFVKIELSPRREHYFQGLEGLEKHKKTTRRPTKMQTKKGQRQILKKTICWRKKPPKWESKVEKIQWQKMSGKKWKKGREGPIGVGRGRGAPHVGGDFAGRARSALLSKTFKILFHFAPNWPQNLQNWTFEFKLKSLINFWKKSLKFGVILEL